MEKFNESSNNMSMFKDYTEYMKKYADTMEKLDKIEDDELSDADRAYYIKVNTRITKKLAEMDY